MEKDEKIMDLILTMIEQSSDRMKQINRKDKDGYCDLDDYDRSAIRLAQKEFEMQLKLLDRATKHMKAIGKTIDVTPENKKIKE